MAITSMMLTCMFDTIQECVPDWSNSYIASNTKTKNINDLLEYDGKLEQQESKRKPKTHHQDNSKSQQQPARNQNQCRQGNQSQHNGNNCHNEESLCSYHQLHGHSDAECHDPHKPRGVNANNAHCNDQNSNHDHDHQQDRNYQNNQDNQSNQQHNHHYPTHSQQQRQENHQQQEASDNCSQCMSRPTIPSPMMKSLPWKKSATSTMMIKTSLPNKAMYQKLLLVHLPTLLQNDTSTSKP
jgi:hypothetical protein